jgi:hypothetical protein
LTALQARGDDWAAKAAATELRLEEESRKQAEGAKERAQEWERHAATVEGLCRELDEQKALARAAGARFESQIRSAAEAHGREFSEMNARVEELLTGEKDKMLAVINEALAEAEAARQDLEDARRKASELEARLAEERALCGQLLEAEKLRKAIESSRNRSEGGDEPTVA